MGIENLSPRRPGLSSQPSALVGTSVDSQPQLCTVLWASGSQKPGGDYGVGMAGWGVVSGRPGALEEAQGRSQEPRGGGDQV